MEKRLITEAAEWITRTMNMDIWYTKWICDVCRLEPRKRTERPDIVYKQKDGRTLGRPIDTVQWFENRNLIIKSSLQARERLSTSASVRASEWITFVPKKRLDYTFVQPLPKRWHFCGSNVPYNILHAPHLSLNNPHERYAYIEDGGYLSTRWSILLPLFLRIWNRVWRIKRLSLFLFFSLSTRGINFPLHLPFISSANLLLSKN